MRHCATTDHHSPLSTLRQQTSSLARDVCSDASQSPQRRPFSCKSQASAISLTLTATRQPHSALTTASTRCAPLGARVHRHIRAERDGICLAPCQRGARLETPCRRQCLRSRARLFLIGTDVRASSLHTSTGPLQHSQHGLNLCPLSSICAHDSYCPNEMQRAELGSEVHGYA